MADKDTRAGNRYADEKILRWVDGIHTPHDRALEDTFTAPEREDMPAIMVGPSEGRFLGLLLRLAGARTVVEIGTLAGYSAIHMARALPEDGRVWTIEADEGYAAVARDNIAAARVDDRVEVVVGAALEVLPTLEDRAPFDAVFIDADKASYDLYGRWAADHLRSGGLILGDNAYLFGNLLDDSDAAAAMRRFHEETAGAFDSVCVPTPDGLVVGIKH